MSGLSIKEILKNSEHVNQEVIIKGWVRSKRDSKAGFSFLAVYDGSCFDPIQVVTPNELQNYDDILKLTTGCAVEIKGKLITSPAKGQEYEVQANEVSIVGWVENPESYPLAKTRQSIEFLREVAHLRPRSNLIGAVARVRNCISQSIHQFFNQEGFLWVASPLITSSDAEGAGEMFKVSTLDFQNIPKTADNKVDYDKDFFGQESYLTVSGQLNAEAYACALSKVYTFGPTFRAENSNTSRHLAEFWMVEPEMAFADLSDVTLLAEKMLKHVFQNVLNECKDDMLFFEKRVNNEVIQRLEKFLKSEFITVDYTDAIEILENANKTFEFPVSWGIDLSSEHERYLAEEHFDSPVVVVNYPKDIKAFYMRLNDDGKTVAAMDVLAPGIGEIMGGAQREERLELLDKRMESVGIEKEHMDWYRDLRKYGTVPHAGWGLGLERLVSYVTGVSNIRDVIPFPRAPRSAKF
ncbi:asparagine--tRNA ligase [Paraphotobacterium marinum]|uniref:Asparagine--tRNA ligase n=1 Tax=Paraphotobacterium marinum TaxID=1755811 RepID=A0A220VE59_9GAMM|nr:asparagine--tRNA ligase [Paraphotobacterium marinum]ASK78647.1 asparagine--tRNA ligase [Paraphotobacterium marinum]